MRKCALEAAQAARYTAHGHAHCPSSSRQLQRCRCSCSCRCRCCSSCRCRCRRRTLLYFERRRNQAKLSVWPPLLLLLLLLRSLFPFFRFFICHNSSSSSSRQRRPKKGSSFSTRCTFHGKHRRRFHYISFHSFIPLPAARCWLLLARCLHSFRTRRFNSTFDFVSLYLQVAVRL